MESLSATKAIVSWQQILCGINQVSTIIIIVLTIVVCFSAKKKSDKIIAIWLMVIYSFLTFYLEMLKTAAGLQESIIAGTLLIVQTLAAILIIWIFIKSIKERRNKKQE